MADLALVTAGKLNVVESIVQDTQLAGESITPGQAVRIDTSTGKFTKSNGTTAPEARVYGVAVSKSATHKGITALRKGVVEGYDLTALAYDAPVYLSDTDGTFGSTAGTVSTVVGRVIAGNAKRLGQSADKLLFVDL